MILHGPCIPEVEAAARELPDDIVFMTLPSHDGAGFRVVASCTTGDQHLNAQGRVLTLARDPVLREVTPTAEHTFGLLWAVQRRGVEAAHHVRAFGSWDRSRFIAGKSWSEMSIYVWGLGRLGQMVLDRAVALGFQPTGDPCRADVVTCHVDLNETTRHAIDATFLDLLRPGAFLVNTARGEVVDDAAVIKALRLGRLGGYGADVLSGEFGHGFDCGGHPLVLAMRDGLNIVLTPHIGGSTQSARRKVQLRMLEKLREHLSGQRGNRPQREVGPASELLAAGIQDHPSEPRGPGLG